MPPRQRWWALVILCLGVFMIVIDMTIVNVALPSIGADLGFSDAGLVWVVNVYLLTFGGCLLLAGRLGDLYGHRRVFLAGIAIFSLTSLVCGLAASQGMLVVARAFQGIGGAIVDAVALSLLMTLFTEPVERTKAMGIYGFVCAGGGSVGVLLGGLLTSALDWHWIFLVNVPIGLAVLVLCLRLLPAAPAAIERVRLDVAGALTITAALMLAVYGVVGGNEIGWRSPQTLAVLGAAAALLAVFVAIESRIEAPLVPLRLFALRNVVTINVVAVLWSAGMFAWFFISALYLQLVLGYSAMQVGLAFLPSNLVMAALSLGASAWLVGRYGLRVPLAGGLALAALGLALFARAPVDGSYAADVLPGMLLLGIGAGVAFNPLLLAAMNDVSADESGLASGVVNTAFMMGGALGLAVLASLAEGRTAALLADGMAQAAALNGGYRLAFGAGAACAALAALLSALVLRPRPSPEGPALVSSA